MTYMIYVISFQIQNLWRNRLTRDLFYSTLFNLTGRKETYAPEHAYQKTIPAKDGPWNLETGYPGT
jgi:hypothetical protein